MSKDIEFEAVASLRKYEEENGDLSTEERVEFLEYKLGYKIPGLFNKIKKVEEEDYQRKINILKGGR